MKTRKLIYLYSISVISAIAAGVITYMNVYNYKVLITILISVCGFSLPVSFVMWFKLLDKLSFQQGAIIGAMFKTFGLLIPPMLLFPYLNYRFYRDMLERKREPV